ncbi:MAG: hypothetical protein K5755_01455 [Clostridiales bacterium]|nr:hypothetical protein [Clostridiales bacterium]
MSENKKKNAAAISLPLIIVGVLLCFFPAIFGHTDTDTKTTEKAAKTTVSTEQAQTAQYTFKTKEKLKDHFKKHGTDTYCKTAEEYLQKANDVINNPNALTKVESDEGDGDRVFYIEETNEIVFLSTDNYIRTYFICSGKDYFDKQ